MRENKIPNDKQKIIQSFTEGEKKKKLNQQKHEKNFWAAAATHSHTQTKKTHYTHQQKLKCAEKDKEKHLS